MLIHSDLAILVINCLYKFPNMTYHQPYNKHQYSKHQKS